jgi:electron transfer flavoprotein alpha subunit
MAVLVLAEHDNAALNDATAKTVAAAQAFGGDIDVLVAGHNAKAAAAAAAKLAGVRKVIHVEGEAFSHALAEAVEALVVPMMAGYDAFFAPPPPTGKNVAPRIAAKLDVMQISEITKVIDASTFERPIYAGNAILTVKSADAKKVVTVAARPSRLSLKTGSASVETAAAPAGPFKARSSPKNAKSDRPELARPSASSPAAAPSLRLNSSTSTSCRSPTSSAPPSAPRAPPSTPAMPRTTTRSARPARSSPRNSTSPSASRAPSSTSPA